MNELLKLYVKPTWVDSGLSYSPLLFPFWGPRFKKSTPFLSSVWKRYLFDAAYYTITQEPNEADAALVPHNYWLLKQKRPEFLSAILREIVSLNKPVVIDAYGDSADRILIPNSIILRTSQYRHNKQPNEIMTPAYVEDLQDIAPTSPREKSPIPTVGFAGWADVSLNANMKSAYFRLLSTLAPKYGCYIPGVMLRKRSLSVLALSPQIMSNFLLRKTYSGNFKTLQGDVQAIRAQFIENIALSDYTLNVKGNGNYSQRFYETLSLGRIPLLLDTECVLPLESLIDYRECCVIVDYREINRIGEILAEFHLRVSPERFLWMQQRSRQIFTDYLRVDRFTKYVVQEILMRLREPRDRGEE